MFTDTASGAALIVKDNLKVNSLDGVIVRLPFQKIFMDQNNAMKTELNGNVTIANFTPTETLGGAVCPPMVTVYLYLKSSQSDQIVTDINLTIVIINGAPIIHNKANLNTKLNETDNTYIPITVVFDDVVSVSNIVANITTNSGQVVVSDISNAVVVF